MAQHDLITREFLESLEERADKDYKGHLHQAFLAWYVEAEFGRHAQWKFTDDVNDGGVDAIVWCPNDVPPVSLIQSKFTDKVGATSLGKDAYEDFHRVVKAFKYGGELFDEFLSKVRNDLKQTYRRVSDQLADMNDWRQEKKAFRLITTAKGRPAAEFDLLPRENFIYAPAILGIYSRYRKGFTPTPKPLRLSIDDKMEYVDRERGMRSYLFNARLSDFQEYFKHSDVARLVARNIRYNLGGKVAKDIRETYEHHPRDFWYYHNGLTIICDKFLEESGMVTLTNPSVVNGAQTLYAISGLKHTRSRALVTVRAIVRSQNGPAEDDEWLQKVICGVNTQNRVLKFDFSSNEPEQVELQHLFQEVKVFYERKRGERKEVRNDPKFRSFQKASLKTLGLILTAVSDTTGEGVVLIKRGIENVFAEKRYRKLFPSRSKVARRFKRIYLAYRLCIFLEDFGYQNSRIAKKQQHARWNTLWLFHLGISRTPRVPVRCTLESIRGALDDFERNGARGRHARMIARKVTRAVWQAWRTARKVDVERWTANNFFKSKFGNFQLLRLAFPKVRDDLKWIGAQLVAR